MGARAVSTIRFIPTAVPVGQAEDFEHNRVGSFVILGAGLESVAAVRLDELDDVGLLQE